MPAHYSSLQFMNRTTHHSLLLWKQAFKMKSEWLTVLIKLHGNGWWRWYVATFSIHIFVGASFWYNVWHDRLLLSTRVNQLWCISGCQHRNEALLSLRPPFLTPTILLCLVGSVQSTYPIIIIRFVTPTWALCLDIIFFRTAQFNYFKILTHLFGHWILPFNVGVCHTPQLWRVWASNFYK